MYDTFGDKRRLYVEALARYEAEQVAGHIKRLRAPKSPLAGVKAVLTGVIAPEKATREMGCMGVGAICEFGAADGELAAMRVTGNRLLHEALVERLLAAQAAGEIAPAVDAGRAARFVQTTMLGLQVAARAGASGADLRATAAFAIAGLANTYIDIPAFGAVNTYASF